MKKIAFIIVSAFMAQSFALTRIVMSPGSSQVVQAGDTLEVSCTGKGASVPSSTCSLKKEGSDPSYGVFIDGNVWHWFHTSAEAITELKGLREAGVCR